MSMSITPVERVLYVEFVAAVHDHHRRDPSEREEKTLHSVARMMLADQENSGELETSLTGIKEIVALIEPHSANAAGSATRSWSWRARPADALLQNEGFGAAEARMASAFHDPLKRT